MRRCQSSPEPVEDGTVIAPMSSPTLRTLFLVLMVVAASALAQSLPAVPRPLVVGQPAQQHASAVQEKAESDQRGTKSAPLVVETVESQSDADEKVDVARHRRSEATNNRISILIAGLALLVAFVQAYLFIRQLSLMRDSLAHSRQAAEATTAATEVALKQFLASHRPHVRAFLFKEVGGPSETIPLALEYVNTGTLPAHVTAIESSVDLWESPRPARQMTNVLEGEVVLNPGERREQLLNFSEPDLRPALGGEEPPLHYWCVARIKYTGPDGANRETGFCRVYEPSTGRWQRVEDSDYEYAY